MCIIYMSWIKSVKLGSYFFDCVTIYAKKLNSYKSQQICIKTSIKILWFQIKAPDFWGNLIFLF